MGCLSLFTTCTGHVWWFSPFVCFKATNCISSCPALWYLSLSPDLCCSTKWFSVYHTTGNMHWSLHVSIIIMKSHSQGYSMSCCTPSCWTVCTADQSSCNKMKLQVLKWFRPRAVKLLLRQLTRCSCKGKWMCEWVRKEREEKRKRGRRWKEGTLCWFCESCSQQMNVIQNKIDRLWLFSFKSSYSCVSFISSWWKYFSGQVNMAIHLYHNQLSPDLTPWIQFTSSMAVKESFRQHIEEPD